MSTSAEQIHHGALQNEPPKLSAAKLFIDLDVCSSGECTDCEVDCSYLYHTSNNGIISVAELASYALVCRKCDEPHCISACPFEALEQRDDSVRILERHNMRCVGCRSCSHACPYGTIYPESVPTLVHNCDYCVDRLDERNEPLCVSTCPFDALSTVGPDFELPDDTFIVGANLVVHSTHWMREKA